MYSLYADDFCGDRGQGCDDEYGDVDGEGHDSSDHQGEAGFLLSYVLSTRCVEVGVVELGAVCGLSGVQDSWDGQHGQDEQCHGEEDHQRCDYSHERCPFFSPRQR